MKATNIFHHINVLIIAQIYEFTHPQKNYNNNFLKLRILVAKNLDVFTVKQNRHNR